MKQRIKGLYADSSAGNAAFGLLVGWVIGHHLSSGTGILLIIVLVFLHGYISRSYFEEHYEDLFPELTQLEEEIVRETTGEGDT